VILGLGLVHPLDAEKLEGLAQFHQRPAVQRAGQIVGRVGQDLAAAQSDKQVEIFARGDGLAGSARSLGERRMGHAERRGVVLQRCQAADQLGAGPPGQQNRQQCLFARTGTIQFIDDIAVRAARSALPHG